MCVTSVFALRPHIGGLWGTSSHQLLHLHSIRYNNTRERESLAVGSTSFILSIST